MCEQSLLLFIADASCSVCAQGILGASSTARPASLPAEQTTLGVQQHSGTVAPQKGHLEWHASQAINFDAGLPSAMDGLSINGHTGLLINWWPTWQLPGAANVQAI